MHIHNKNPRQADEIRSKCSQVQIFNLLLYNWKQCLDSECQKDLNFELQLKYIKTVVFFDLHLTTRQGCPDSYALIACQDGIFLPKMTSD